MKLLQRLKSETPRGGRPDVRSRRVYQLVKKHFNELAQARAMGYSWSQIKRCARDTWSNEIKWGAEIWDDVRFINRYFDRIRKEFINEQ